MMEPPGRFAKGDAEDGERYSDMMKATMKTPRRSSDLMTATPEQGAGPLK
jgi:hypothetical protein